MPASVAPSFLSKFNPDDRLTYSESVDPMHNGDARVQHQIVQSREDIILGWVENTHDLSTLAFVGDLNSKSSTFNSSTCF